MLQAFSIHPSLASWAGREEEKEVRQDMCGMDCGNRAGNVAASYEAAVADTTVRLFIAEYTEALVH